MRERVGLTECSNFAKYRVTGAGAADWLQGLFTNRLPKVGRIALTAMLNPDGRIVGEFSVARTGDDEFFLFGSQAAEVHHSRWFLAHLPAGDADPLRGARPVARRAVGRRAARPRRAAVGDGDVAGDRRLPVHDVPARRRRDGPGVGRADDLHGRPRLRDLGRARVPAGAVRRAVGRRPAARHGPVRLPGADVAAHGEELRHVVPRVPADLHAARGGDGALPQARPRLRRPCRAGGGDGARARALARLPRRRPRPDEPADVIGDEPIWHDGEVVGWVTSGAYAHHSGRSLALGYVPAALAVPGATFEVEIIGHRRPARLLDEPVLDPAGRADARPEWAGSPTSSDAGSCSTASSPTSPSTASPACRCGRWPARSVSASTASSTTSGRRRRWSSPRCAGRSRCRRTSQAGWLRRQPELSMTELLRRWWRWINASPANLALVRLGIEAAALDATVSGLPGDVRADQIGAVAGEHRAAPRRRGHGPAAGGASRRRSSRRCSPASSSTSSPPANAAASPERWRPRSPTSTSECSTPSECQACGVRTPSTPMDSNTRMDVVLDGLRGQGVAPVMRSAAFSASIITGA